MALIVPTKIENPKVVLPGMNIIKLQTASTVDLNDTINLSAMLGKDEEVILAMSRTSSVYAICNVNHSTNVLTISGGGSNTKRYIYLYVTKK